MLTSTPTSTSTSSPVRGLWCDLPTMASELAWERWERAQGVARTIPALHPLSAAGHRL
jgi:hypothetical protein